MYKAAHDTPVSPPGIKYQQLMVRMVLSAGISGQSSLEGGLKGNENKACPLHLCS
jgi:hypothetical protein